MSLVGVVGLGTMGSGVARNLRERGYDVVVSDVDGDARPRAEQDALRWRGTAADVAAECREVVVSVPGPDEVHTVVAGPGGLLDGWAGRSGATVLDMSTIGPVAARAMHAMCAERGASYVEAAVSGGPNEVRTGTAGLFLAGDRSAVDAVRPLLDLMGATTEYFGPPGAAQSAKVALNAFYGAFQAGLAETLAQLHADGVDVDAFQRVVAPVDYREWVDLTVDGWREGRTDAGFRMDLLLKDMRLALAARRELGTGTAGAEATVEVLERACAAGLDRTGVAALASTLGPPDGRNPGT